MITKTKIIIGLIVLVLAAVILAVGYFLPREAGWGKHSISITGVVFLFTSFGLLSED